MLEIVIIYVISNVDFILRTNKISFNVSGIFSLIMMTVIYWYVCHRVLWIREKVMKFLALGSEYKLFNDLINVNFFAFHRKFVAICCDNYLISG